MSDIVERLRSYGSPLRPADNLVPIWKACSQAADEITRLETELAAANARIERLEKALKALLKASQDYYDISSGYFSDTDYDRDGGLGETAAELFVIALPKARATLEGK